MTTSTTRGQGLGARFGRLWAATTLSGLGDGVTQIAGAALAGGLSRDPLPVSGLLVAQYSAGLLLSLPGGAMVDRLDRRHVLIATSLTRVLAVGLLAGAAATGRVSFPLLYAVFFLIGCAGVLFETAAAAAIPALVRAEQLHSANGRLFAAKGLAEQLLAKPLGGGLFLIAAWLPFLIDCAALLVIVVLSGLLPPTAAEDRRASGSLWSATRAGLKHLGGHRLLRSLTVTVALSNVGLGAVFSIIILIAQERLRIGSFGLGLLMAAAALGGAAGGLLVGPIATALGPGTTLRAGLLVELVAHVGLAFTHHPVVAGLLLAVLSMHLVLFSAISSSIRQTLTPIGMLGRVHSVYRLMTTTGMVVGSLLGGILGHGFGLTAPFWLGAGCVTVLGTLVWRVLGEVTSITPHPRGKTG